MRYWFAQQRAAWRREVRRRKPVLAFDFDGTLAPIVDSPQAAAMRPTTHALLAAVSQRHACAIITGRSLADVQGRVAGGRLVAAYGNHGIEPLADLQAMTVTMEAYAAQLGELVAALPGAWLEAKGYSASIHYRAVPASYGAQAFISRALRDEIKLRLVHGKRVVNVVPVLAPDKGACVRQLLAQHGEVCFFGDDVTDEDGFAVGAAHGVRVGWHPRSHAKYYIRRQAQIADVLREWLRDP